MNRNKIFLVLAISLILIGIVSAGSYQYSNPKYTQGLPYSSFDTAKYSKYDNTLCQEGQDFIVQVAPAGCTPVVVRSDLLEEEDVDVFCQLQAIKINPLVNVDSISHINFEGARPEGVSAIAYHPNRAALNRNGELNGMSWNNIGYLVITINREMNESAMPEFISGNIVAKIKYNFNEELGLGRQTFYLPELDDSEFNKDMGLYSFFNNRAYLRATNINEDSTDIGIYTGELNSPGVAGSNDRRQIQNFNIDTKDRVERVLIPGYDCMTSINVELNKIDVQDERVRLSINSEIIEVREGESFLDDKCTVRKIDKNGIDQFVEISCTEDRKGRTTFPLYITPRVVLEIDGEEKTYSVGDWLYDAPTNSDRTGSVYLGYATSNGNAPFDLAVQLVLAPTEKDKKKLSEEEISMARYFIEADKKQEFVNNILPLSLRTSRWIIEGSSYEGLAYHEVKKEVFDTQVYVTGFAGNVNEQLGRNTIGENARNNYDMSVEDYDTILQSFFSEEDPINTGAVEKTISEKGLKDKIALAYYLGQKLDVNLFCDEFDSAFPKSVKPEICTDVIKLSNNKVSTREVVVNGNHKLISFEGVYVPTFEDYGITLDIKKGSSFLTKSTQLIKNRASFFDTSNTVELSSLTKSKAVIEIGIKNSKTGKYEYKELTLIQGKEFSYEGYSFILSEVNLNNVAKVVVDATSPIDGSHANFSFRVGIEKRSIQLSPAQTKNKIDKLNKTLEDWSRISEKLGGVVEGLKTACLATGSLLTIKNAVFNSKKSIARQKVMVDWKSKCSALVSANEFNTMDGCYFKYADEIDSDVSSSYDKMQEIDEDIKTATSKITVKKENWWGENVIPQEELLIEYSKTVSSNIESKSGSVDIEGSKTGPISHSKIAEILKEASSMKEGVFSIEDLKDIEFYRKTNDDKNLYLVYEKILRNRAALDLEIRTNEASENIGYEANFLSTTTNKDSIIGVYEGAKTKAGVFDGVGEGEPIQAYVFNQDRYFFVLTYNGKDEYSIKEIYNYETQKRLDDVDKRATIQSHFKNFKKSIGFNGNKFKEMPKVSFFANEPYKNLPSFVPIDIDNGWYVEMEYTLPSYGGIRAYDDSGVLNSFDLCNIGVDGVVDPDDECLGIITRQKTDATMKGLSLVEKEKLVNLAISEVAKLSKAGSKKGSVAINGKNIEIGAPDTGSIKADCSDFMSPKECKVLFNLCDPVICPTSRCDLGGNYKVRDVVQSGIVGSLALCLPNVKEGIAIPICLSGVKAGIDGMLSVSEAHRDCLQESLDTGRTVGICDQQNSVYMCELLWKQAIPLANIAIPKILGGIAGQNSRGGAEYTTVKSAWDNARDSIAFFTDSYGINAVKAFRARGTGQDEIGSAVCKNFVSMSYPGGQGFLKNLVSADSPPQFKAEFNEINQNTITNPPMSHYKVFFHIYAGNDQGAHYKVWLRGSDDSYYDDQGATRIVDSGFIKTGGYSSETIDFTAPSGYKELCVQVNEQEECGFKEISTSFSSNFFQDYYLKTQVNQTDISSEGECISGSPNLLALATTSNIQEGIGDVINPEIYNQGISRVCATSNPGYSTDGNMGKEGQRWIEVGDCGEEKMKCWLDLETIDDAFVFDKTTEDLKKEFSDDYSKNFMSENGYLDDDFDNIVKNITREKFPEIRVRMIGEYMDKIFRNQNKAYLYYLRAGAYGEIAKDFFVKYKEKLSEDEDKKLVVGPRERSENILDIVGASNFVSNKFEVQMTSFEDNLCFMYDKTEWKWRNTCKDSEVTARKSFGETTFDYKEMEWNSINEKKDASSTEADFIKKLTSKNYVDGFKIITSQVQGSRDSSNFVESVDIIMNSAPSSPIFVVSNLEDVDELYFKYISGVDSPGWRWGFENYNAEADWIKVEDIAAKQDNLNILENINNAGHAINEFTGLNNVWAWVGLDKSVKINPKKIEINGDSKLLITLLVEKTPEEGSLILFSGKDIWKRLGEKNVIVVGKYSIATALKELQELEDNYKSESYVIDKQKVIDDTKTLVRKLIEDEWLTQDMLHDFSPDRDFSNWGVSSYFFDNGEPDFDKIRSDLNQVQVDRGIGVSGQFSAACVQYSDKVNEVTDKLVYADANLVFAVMQQESKCNADAKSPTGCLGLMQFCAPTAYDYGLCDCVGSDCGKTGTDKKYCAIVDDRTDADKSIEAGSKYLNVLVNRYNNYEDGKLLAIAAYNGGMGLIDSAIKNVEGKVNWNNVKAEITPELLKTFNVYTSSGWTDELRYDKTLEIKNYVQIVSTNMGMTLPGTAKEDDIINTDTNKIIDKINSFEVDYSSYVLDTEKVREDLRLYIKELISQKILNPTLPNNNEYFYFSSSGEPDFDKIRMEILGQSTEVKETEVVDLKSKKFSDAISKVSGLSSDELSQFLIEVVNDKLLTSKQADTRDKEKIKDFLKMEKVIYENKVAWTPYSAYEAVKKLRGDSTYGRNEKLFDDFFNKGGAITQEEHTHFVIWYNQWRSLSQAESKILEGHSEEINKGAITELEKEIEKESCEIINVAKAKIGEDTTRTENGEEVYDNVCATFVSRVLYEAGALNSGDYTCGITDIPYTTAIASLDKKFESEGFIEIKKDKWSSGLIKGDIIINGLKDKDFQHIVIFEEYKGNGIAYIHDGGAGSVIGRSSIGDINGETWHISKAWRSPSCSA